MVQTAGVTNDTGTISFEMGRLLQGFKFGDLFGGRLMIDIP